MSIADTLCIFTDMSNWYERAKKRLRAINRTQDEMAEAIGVTRGAIGHWLSGRREPNVSDFAKIATYLETTTSQLLAEDIQQGEDRPMEDNHYKALSADIREIIDLLVKTSPKDRQVIRQMLEALPRTVDEPKWEGELDSEPVRKSETGNGNNH